jgi:aconitate hydratase
MLAIGTGGLDVALAAAGEQYVKMPKIMGIKLVGKLPNWVSAKDIVLEMLRVQCNWRTRLYIRILWPRFKTLSAWDRHVIANMGTELGATTSVFRLMTPLVNS